MKNKGSNLSTNPKPIYKAEEADQQDSHRQTILIVISSLGIGIAMTYLAFFGIYLNSKFSLMYRGKSLEILILIAGFIVFIFPVLLEFVSLKYIRENFKKFTKSFYNISDEIDIEPLIQRKLFGLPRENPTASTPSSSFIVVNSDKLDDKFSWVYSLGGPIKLIIYDGYGVYLERGGKFSRVIGSGIMFLERYETVRDIIDLRPQVKELKIDAWTKDGIELTLHVRVECQILSAEDAESSQKMDASPEAEKRFYPFYDKAVQSAVETAAVRLNNDGQLEKYDWIAGVCGNLEGYIREHVYSNTINNLLRDEEINQKKMGTRVQQFQSINNGQPATRLLSTELRNLLREKVNTDVKRLGARLVDLQIAGVERSFIVDHQWEKNWRVEWESINTITAGEAEAYKIRTIETAHAEAQKDMILAIARGLEKVAPQHMSEPLLLSLSGMLEHSLVDPYVRAVLPRETLETLEKIKTILEEPPP
jgi:hypothetical protein